MMADSELNQNQDFNFLPTPNDNIYTNKNMLTKRIPLNM